MAYLELDYSLSIYVLFNLHTDTGIFEVAFICQQLCKWIVIHLIFRPPHAGGALHQGRIARSESQWAPQEEGLHENPVPSERF
jgi:hypothetical protein